MIKTLTSKERAALKCVQSVLQIISEPSEYNLLKQVRKLEDNFIHINVDDNIYIEVFLKQKELGINVGFPHEVNYRICAGNYAYQEILKDDYGKNDDSFVVLDAVQIGKIVRSLPKLHEEFQKREKNLLLGKETPIESLYSSLGEFNLLQKSERESGR